VNTITEIYKGCRINAGLQMHMLRVAAVASILCDHAAFECDTEHVISACLLHDMGNIIKAKLEMSPELFEPEGIAYWSKVQKEFTEKFGNEHHAAMEIAKELGVSVATLGYIDMVGMGGLVATAERGDLNNKICSYSDMRVGLYGVLSLEDRLGDLFARQRQAGRYDEKQRDEWRSMLVGFEKELFAGANIKPEDINDEPVAFCIAKLKSYIVV